MTSEAAPRTVPRVSLASGLQVSRVVVGLWQVADQERRRGSPLDPKAGARAMAEYARAGFTTFDMADHYGSAEVVAGELVRQEVQRQVQRQAQREVGRPAQRHTQGMPGGDALPVQLLTKWVPAPGRIARQTVADAVDRARERMGVDAIDLLQFHAWNYADPSWLDALFYLAEQRESGAIRHLGVTNFDAVHLDMALRSGIPITTNQVCCSLLDRRALGATSRVCRLHDVKLLAYGVLAGGLLTRRWLGRAAPQGDESTWSQTKYMRFVREAGGWDRVQELLRVVRRVADRLGVSMAGVACRYVLDQPAVASVIVGARLGERSHAEDNARMFGWSLDEDARAELEAAADRMNPIPGDCGDEYRRPPFLTAWGDLSHHVQLPLPAPYPVTRADPSVEHVSTGTPWERIAGYSRAVRRGDRIWVSGTTASHRDRRIGGDDAAAQTHFVVDKIEGTLQSLGASLADVVRTRIFISEETDSDAVARVHGVRFGSVSPANTLVRAGLVGEGLLVEIEAEAVAGR